MQRWEPAAATGVAGIAIFELVRIWNDNAPSLQDLRKGHRDDYGYKNQLLDADILVGGLAVIAGTALSIMTRNPTALILLLVTFGLVSLWHHAVLNATQVKPENT